MTAVSPLVIDFYLDFISSFGYLARGRLCDIAARHGAVVAWHPVEIGRLRTLAGNTGPTNSAIPAKLAYLTRDYKRWAELYGLPIVDQLGGWQTGRLNRGLLLAVDRDDAAAYAKEAWSCVWAEGLDPAADATLEAVERRIGWDTGAIAAFADSEAALARYDAGTEAASARGVFGVPTFMIGDEMWWGNDRLDFLERWLDTR